MGIELETDAMWLGEVLEFITRYVYKFQGEKFEITKEEYDAITSLAEKIRPKVEPEETQVIDILTHMLYINTFVDDESDGGEEE